MSFGSMLRAYRLGYRYSDKHRCFIRMSDGPSRGIYRVELAPISRIPNKTGSKEHRCWWDDGATLLDLCKPLTALCGVKRPLTFYVDANGELIVNG